MDMDKEYASKGVAGAGLGTGIAGLSLGVINSLGGLAGLGGLLGGNRCTAAKDDVLAAVMAASLINNGRSVGYCFGDCAPVTQRELDFVQQLAEKDKTIAKQDTENALLKANTYNDQKSLEMYKYVDGRFREFEAELAKQAVKNQATKDSFQLLQQQATCDKKELLGAISRERDERRCNDNTIINYVNETFYPEMVADVAAGTTTTAKKTYNPLPVCNCDCGS